MLPAMAIALDRLPDQFVDYLTGIQVGTGGAPRHQMLPVMAIARVWATVFSCGVKGFLDQPFLMMNAENGFRMVKEMRPAAQRRLSAQPLSRGRPPPSSGAQRGREEYHKTWKEPSSTPSLTP